MLHEKDGKNIQIIGFDPAGRPEHGEADHGLGNEIGLGCPF
jgi:hypothetical protein